MNINGRQIDQWHAPYVIAEMSCNHGGRFETACDIIKAAKDAGADAVKLQVYTADSMTIDANLFIDGGAWQGRDLYSLYQHCSMPKSWTPKLFEYAESIGITCFASVYDVGDLEELEQCGCPAYKVASFEAMHLDLLTAIGRTGKPCIVSTGVVDDGEILEAMNTLYIAGCPAVAFLHCNSTYPTSYEECALGRIQSLKRWLNGRCVIGYSDHTSDGIGYLAAAAGACILERHICLETTTDTEDMIFSSTPFLFELYCDDALDAWKAIQDNERKAGCRMLRRSVYAVADIADGERFTRENVRVIRPGYGLHPRMFNAVLGSVATAPIRRGEPITTHNADIIGV